MMYSKCSSRRLQNARLWERAEMKRFNNSVWLQDEKIFKANSRLCPELRKALGADHGFTRSVCSNFLCCYTQDACSAYSGAHDFTFSVDTNEAFSNSSCGECQDIRNQYINIPEDDTCAVTVHASDCVHDIANLCASTPSLEITVNWRWA